MASVEDILPWVGNLSVVTFSPLVRLFCRTGRGPPPTEAPMSETETNNRDLCQVSGEYALGGLTLFRLKATLGSSAVELVLTRGFVLGADQNVRLG